MTTTTWTITWQDNAVHSAPGTDPVANEFPNPEAAQHIQQYPPIIQTKEDDLSVIESVTDPTADEPPQDPNPY